MMLNTFKVFLSCFKFLYSEPSLVFNCVVCLLGFTLILILFFSSLYILDLRKGTKSFHFCQHHIEREMTSYQDEYLPGPFLPRPPRVNWRGLLLGLQFLHPQGEEDWVLSE